MSTFKIKEPGIRNIKKTVDFYNVRKGRGIELFYNIKKGKLIIADYYKNFNHTGYRKVPTVADDIRMPAITPEYIAEQIQIIKEHELKDRAAEKKKEKEDLMKFKAQRKAYYRSKFKLSK